MKMKERRVILYIRKGFRIVLIPAVTLPEIIGGLIYC
jgi:hypothetical protein